MTSDPRPSRHLFVKVPAGQVMSEVHCICMYGQPCSDANIQPDPRLMHALRRPPATAGYRTEVCKQVLLWDGKLSRSWSTSCPAKIKPGSINMYQCQEQHALFDSGHACGHRCFLAQVPRSMWQYIACILERYKQHGEYVHPSQFVQKTSSASHMLCLSLLRCHASPNLHGIHT